MRFIPPLAALGLAAALGACAPTAMIGGGALVTASVVQERSTRTALDDTAIGVGVQTRLGNHSGELFRDVHVSVTEGHVVLTGTVPRPEDRVAAAEAAWATPGVLAVDDALEVAEDGGARRWLEDVTISNDLRLALVADGAVQSLNYTVTTIDGVVHLTGLARSASELERVVGHARQVAGVRRVVSHVLTIDDPRRVSRIAKG